MSSGAGDEPRFPPPPVQRRVRPPAALPYQCAQVRLELCGVDIDGMNRAQLAGLLAEVVNIESPVHWTKAARRLCNGMGIQRFGSRIRRAFREAVHQGVAEELFIERKEFLWRPGMLHSPVRDRSKLPAACRRFEFIAPEETQRAILTVVKESDGVLRAVLPRAVCRLLGVDRGTGTTAVVTSHCNALLRQRYLSLEGMRLV